MIRCEMRPSCLISRNKGKINWVGTYTTIISTISTHPYKVAGQGKGEQKYVVDWNKKETFERVCGCMLLLTLHPVEPRWAEFFGQVPFGRKPCHEVPAKNTNKYQWKITTTIYKTFLKFLQQFQHFPPQLYLLKQVLEVFGNDGEGLAAHGKMVLVLSRGLVSVAHILQADLLREETQAQQLSDYCC